MSLKFRSSSLLDHQNITKPIPHCSNFRKIIFLKNGQSYILSTSGLMDNGYFLATVQWSWSCSFTLTPLSMWRGVYTTRLTGWWHMCSRCTVLAIPRGTKEGVLRHQPSRLTFSNQRYLHQISINFENQRHFWNLLVLRFLKHTLPVQFECLFNEKFQVEVQPNFCFRFLSKMKLQCP